MTMPRRLLLALFLALAAAAPASGIDIFEHGPRRSGEENARHVIKRMTALDPGIADVLDRAEAYAVFPKVGKVGFILGGGGGNGKVFMGDEYVGNATLSMYSVGFQAGGEVYSEVVVFQDEATFERFQQGRFQFTANVSAVVVTAGVSKNAMFKDGVIVYVLTRGGVMFDVSVGGQKIKFRRQR